MSEATRARGLSRLLVVVYAIFAIAATSRSIVQLATRFNEAPVAYLLSAAAALVYIVATGALALGERGRRIATIAIGFELAGVLIGATPPIVSATRRLELNVQPLGNLAAPAGDRCCSPQIQLSEPWHEVGLK
jgi:drug/metabolite transporter (DMT)-like permease